MFCKYCGHEMSDNAKFCDECGKKITADQPVSRICPYCAEPLPKYAQMCRNCLNDIPNEGEPIPPQKDNMLYKLFICIGVFVLFVFVLLFFVVLNGEKKQSEPEIYETTEFVSETVEKETISTEEDLVVSMNFAAAYIESTLRDTYSYVTVSVEGSTLVVDVSEDGIASAITAAASGNEKLKAEWKLVCDSYMNLSEAIRDMAESIVGNNISVLLQIKNDLNHDNALLIIFDGEIIFDAVNSK